MIDAFGSAVKSASLALSPQLTHLLDLKRLPAPTKSKVIFKGLPEADKVNMSVVVNPAAMASQ